VELVQFSYRLMLSSVHSGTNILMYTKCTECTESTMKVDYLMNFNRRQYLLVKVIFLTSVMYY